MAGVLIALLATLAATDVLQASDIKINGSGYTDILIGIKDTIPESEAPALILQIKDLFTKSSHFLYKASHQRVYFRDIKILLPSEWTTFSGVQGAKDGWDYEAADIKVYNGAGLQYPKTIQSGLCGVQGNAILLPDEFVLDTQGQATKRYGALEKSIVKEWSQFRYGVFDESGSYYNQRYPVFYLERGEIQVTSCANKPLFGERKDMITNGTCNLDSNGKPDQNCRFHVDESRSQPTSSLMSHHTLPTVEFFCEDSDDNGRQHSRFVTNKHNDLCNRRSVWSVIKSHSDFSTNDSSTGNINITPTFTLVQPLASKVVLTLDCSGSMDDQMTNLIRSSSSWVENDFIANNSLGIVAFTHVATVKMPIRMIEVPKDRHDAAAILKTLVADGGTCINSGVSTAIQLIRNTGDTEGGIVVLMTDGQNGCDNGQNVRDAIPEIQAAKVRVFTIAFTSAADPDLEYLAKESGGLGFTARPDTARQDLYNAFLEITKFLHKRNKGRSAKIVDRAHNITANIVGSFSIEQELSDIIQMRFIYLTHNVDKIQIIRPSGKQNNFKKKQHSFVDGMVLEDQNDTDIRCVWNEGLVYITYERDVAAGIQEVGSWRYGIFLSNNVNTHVTVVVTAGSYAHNETGETPEIVTASSRIHANTQITRQNPNVVITVQIMYGENPVVDAIAQAKIEIENRPDIEIELLDNGNGDPDVEAKDGIYSARLTQFPSLGRYQIKIDIFGVENVTYAQLGFRNNFPSNDELQKKMLKPFLRQLHAGSINVVEDLSEQEQFIPPGKITDLQISSVQNLQAVLQWTAPGASGKTGQVADYIIKGSDNITDLIESFNLTDTNTLNYTKVGNSTAKSGQNQQVYVELDPRLGSTVYIAVQAVNKYQLKGEFSNIAHYEENILPTTVIPTNKPPSGNKTSHYNIFVNLRMNMSLTIEKTDE